MPTHSRRKSWLAGLQHHTSKSKSSAKEPKEKEKEKEPKPSKHQRNNTAPDPPTLLRLPSTTSTAPSASTSRSRRASNPSTPTASSDTSASYFSPQEPPPPVPPVPQALQDPRSPGARRPPASHSGHGIDNSRGPPIALLTRGNSDIAPRRTTQKPVDQFVHAGVASTPGTVVRRRRDDVGAAAAAAAAAAAPQPKQTHSRSSSSRRASSTSASAEPPPPARPMPSSIDDSSDYDSGPRSQVGQIFSGPSSGSGNTDEEPAEDVFLNIATERKHHRSADKTMRIDRLKSRVARVNERQQSPNRTRSPLPIQRSFTTPNSTRVAPPPEPKSSGHRRPALTASQTLALPGRASPLPAHISPRANQPDLSHRASFSKKDSDLNPREFLAQFSSRRASQQETVQTPPQRTASYRPSNLNYSSSRADPKTPQVETVYETTSKHDGTESHTSTGAGASVWDELDELKTRIRKIELGGKIPSTSGAVVSQASGDRPRTANTSATTVSSSPNQPRKPNPAPSEATVDTQASITSRVHPLLRDALTGAKQHIAPSVYRILEATASEALTLAEIAGAGPPGTLHSVTSNLSGSTVSDRQIRRRADNICRSLTELCIAMSDSKNNLASPAMRSSAAAIQRRPSVHLSSESPSVRQSIEPESNTLAIISPSRALSRIEARRSLQTTGNSGLQRESSQEPLDDRHIPSRLSRAGTSLLRTRGNANNDEDEEEPQQHRPTHLRAPSRTMTEYRSMRAGEQNRLSTGRSYMSREPMPELQPSPAIRPTSALRRPTLAGISNESSLLFRNNSQRYEINRENSPAMFEKPTPVSQSLRSRAHLSAARNPHNRNSIGGVSELNRTVSMGARRVRGSSIDN